MGDEPMSEHTRRSDDRDRMLNGRLDNIEREYQTLYRTVVGVQSDIALIKQDTGHLKDLVNARIATLERTLELAITKLEALSANLQAMASEPERMPATKMLKQEITQMHAELDENRDKLAEHARAHTNLQTWRNQVEGALQVFKYLGIGTVIWIAVSVLRALKVIP